MPLDRIFYRGSACFVYVMINAEIVQKSGGFYINWFLLQITVTNVVNKY